MVQQTSQPEAKQQNHSQETSSLDQVTFSLFVDETIQKSECDISMFTGGRLKHSKWKSLTSDKIILNAITGHKIEFLDIPNQHAPKPNLRFSSKEITAINNDVAELLKKGVIVRCNQEKNDFVSPIFVRPKKDGHHRLILNLKDMNQYIEYHHFKMDTYKLLFQ